MKDILLWQCSCGKHNKSEIDESDRKGVRSNARPI